MPSLAYFIDGMLIDTGHINMKREIEAALIQLPIQQVFITHYHEDHTGNLIHFQEERGLPSYAHPRCVEIMKNPPKISLPQHIRWGNRPANFKLKPVEGEIQTEHYSFQIIEIPGHASDMVGLYEPKKNWLFSSDLYVHHKIKYFLKSERFQPQIDSIKKILELDFDVMFCGHNPQFSGAKALLQRKLQFLIDFQGEVLRFHQAGYSPANIMKAMKLKEIWAMRLLSWNYLSTLNMIKAVLKDEGFIN